MVVNSGNLSDGKRSGRQDPARELRVGPLPALIVAVMTAAACASPENDASPPAASPVVNNVVMNGAGNTAAPANGGAAASPPSGLAPAGMAPAAMNPVGAMGSPNPSGSRGAQVDGADAGAGCAAERAEATLVKEPIDIIMVLDNSGSMDDELRSVEANINVNFASILEESALDYRVILISEHRTRDRDDTSVCIESPLSGLAQCSADEPVFSEHFFHYSTEVGSRNSFDVLLETYAPPIARARRDDFDNAPNGWSEWLRPEAKKVFLEFSDDDENVSASTFLFELSALSQEQFGNGLDDLRLVWHSVVGLAEKASPGEPYAPTDPIETAECDDVKNAGQTYQELSRLTGGLRFPICRFDAYDAVFQAIAEDVVLSGDVACDFQIPTPPMEQVLDLNKVAVSYTPGAGGSTQVFDQAATTAGCREQAFYIEGERIHLCPEACDAIRADPAAAIDVVFTCENTVTLE